MKTFACLMMLLFVLPLRCATDLTIPKTPFEIFNCSVDFAAPAGTDLITLNSVTSKNAKTGANSSAQIIATSPVPAVTSTTKVVFAVQGGAVGEIHLVSVKVTDSITGEKFEGKVTVVVSSGF